MMFSLNVAVLYDYTVPMPRSWGVVGLFKGYGSMCFRFRVFATGRYAIVSLLVSCQAPVLTAYIQYPSALRPLDVKLLFYAENQESHDEVRLLCPDTHEFLSMEEWHAVPPNRCRSIGYRVLYSQWYLHTYGRRIS